MSALLAAADVFVGHHPFISFALLCLAFDLVAKIPVRR